LRSLREPGRKLEGLFDEGFRGDEGRRFVRLIDAEIDEIDQILRMLSKEMNVAVLIVEHRIELLESIADRVIMMDAGEVIAQGALAAIIDSPAVRAAYFEAH
jgi:branched-chain amino acid transport system ATP-binding protein